MGIWGKRKKRKKCCGERRKSQRSTKGASYISRSGRGCCMHAQCYAVPFHLYECDVHGGKVTLQPRWRSRGGLGRGAATSHLGWASSHRHSAYEYSCSHVTFHIPPTLGLLRQDDQQRVHAAPCTDVERCRKRWGIRRCLMCLCCWASRNEVWADVARLPGSMLTLAAFRDGGLTLHQIF